MAQLYKQIEGNDRGKLVEIVGEDKDALTIKNVKSGFKYEIFLRSFWKGFEKYNVGS